MDIYSQFSLPPPPPPGPFSLWSGPDRARLPNLTNVASAAAFLDRLTFYKRPKAYEAQFLFGIFYFSFLGCVIAAIIYKKRQQHAWWLFRVIQRDRRKLIVPQVHNTWTLGALFYGVVCMGRFFTEYIYYRKGEPVPHLTLWIILQWIPLSIACLWQAWGISVARPQSSQATSRRNSTSRRSSSWPAVSNFVWLSIPVAQALVCVVLAVLADRSLQQAYQGRVDWLSRWGTSAQLERDMLVEIINIWSHVLKAWFYVCISMCVWAAYALGLFFIYSTVSWRLIASLREHFRMLQREEAEAAGATTLASVSRTAVDHTLPVPESPMGFSGKETPSLSADSPGYSKHDASSPGFHADDEILADVTEADDDQGFAWYRTPAPGSLSTGHEERIGRYKTFLPPVRRSISISIAPTSHSPVSHKQSQARWVLRYFMIQAVSVSLGILCVQSLPILLAATLYSAAEFAVTERFDGTAYLAGSWVAFVFGTVTLLSIGHATYESSFNQLVHHADESESAAPPLRTSISAAFDRRPDLLRQQQEPVAAPPAVWTRQVHEQEEEDKGIRSADSYWLAQEQLAQEQRPIHGLLSPEAFRSYPRRDQIGTGTARHEADF
ncbi:hypothetical protein OC846_002282 [Tilletia horrida]|uniref:Uncharacterized protein n=1 Tax=Tilletia horrida TaxID=155126 RepID=A0AAN6JV29_9BASI|nr:hypothetical protein OC846_002282 [Tilletia horrida]